MRIEHPREADYGRSGGPWAEQTLGRLLLELREPGVLFTTERASLRGDAILPLVQAVAGGLEQLGVGRGDIVVWQFPNCVEAFVVSWATWWLGAVAAPFHMQATAAEIAAVLTRIEPRLFVASTRAPLQEVHSTTVVGGDVGLAPIMGDAVDVPRCEPGDVAALLTTAGSSGQAKLVIHTQRTLAHKARQLPLLHGTGPGDAVLVPAQLAHMAGLIHGVLHPVSAGVKAVVMERWDADAALERIRTERVTLLFGPPVFALGIVGAPAFGREAVASVRLIASGGTTIREDFAREMASTFDATVKRSYGSTEAPIVTNTFAGDPVERGWTTEGRVVPEAELEVRDEEGAPVPDGVEGDLWIRGPEVAEGYLDPDQTESAFVDGWFRAWDRAVISDGWLRICGRSADVIIRGGANISASEVEAALERHPAIRQAIVVGYPDDVYGERIGAFVVSDEPIDRAHCVRWFADSGVAKYKVPDHVVVLESIPMLSAYQKPDRNALRERMARETQTAR